MSEVVQQVQAFIERAAKYTKSKMDANPDASRDYLLKFLGAAADFIIG